MRELRELTHTTDPAWPEIQALLNAAGPWCEILPALPDRREQVLLDVQVSPASALGALVWHTGMIMVDHRWLRLYGAGTPDSPPARRQRLRGTGPGRDAEGVIVAADVLGGCFAIHGHGLDAEPGDVCYWAPQTLRWENLRLRHTALVEAVLAEGAQQRWADFYADLRWPGWESESAALRPHQGISLYPPPWTREGKDPATVSRRAVALAEVIDIGFDTAAQLDHPR